MSPNTDLLMGPIKKVVEPAKKEPLVSGPFVEHMAKGGASVDSGGKDDNNVPSPEVYIDISGGTAVEAKSNGRSRTMFSGGTNVRNVEMENARTHICLGKTHEGVS